MKAVYMPEPWRVSIIDLPEPKVNPEDVLIRVHRVGLCGTDLHSFRGCAPLTKYPLVPGHEVGGEVVSLGESVPTGMFIPGEHVTVKPYFNCGHCYPCSIKRINCCENSRTMGVQMQEGALCDYISVPYKNVLGCEALSFADIALIEPLAVGAHLASQANIHKGDNVLVFGCGVIGLGAISAAYFLGANVFAVDIAEEKFDTARAMGAKDCINSKTQNLEAEISRLTGGEGVSVALEAIGFGGTMAKAIEVVNFAGRVGYVGYGSGELPVNANLIVKKELAITGSRNATTEEFKTVMNNVSSNQLDFGRLVSAVYPVLSARQAFREWDKSPDRFVKIQICFD